MSKRDVPAIISGLGVGASILASLVAKVLAAGVHDDIHRLSTPEGEPTLDELAQLIVARGSGSSLIVDLDADPFCPEGWTVVSHKKGGKRKFDRNSIGLYLADGQKNNGRMVGNDLQAVLADQPVENANQLDWYLAHPDQIPEDWKGKAVFFWGTIYRDADRRLCVRCLCWGGDGWRWGCLWLGVGFGSGHPAAVRK
jgi:hypothetical protein